MNESAGYLHTCAIKNNSEFRCWGNDTLGQVEGNDLNDFNCIIFIAASLMHNCLIEDVRELMRSWANIKQKQIFVFFENNCLYLCDF